MEHMEHTFSGIKGLKIFHQSWIPASPKAAVMFVHGAHAHSDFAPYLIKKLISAQYATYADDHRGHGRSEGERLYVDSFDDYVEDEKALFEIIRSNHPDLPVFMIGHSLGSLIAFHFARKYESLLKGLVLTGTGASIKIPLFQRLMLKLFSSIAPHKTIGEPMDPKLSSENPEVLDMIEKDPLYIKKAFPFRFANGLLNAMEGMMKTAGMLKLPLMIQNGSDDKVIVVFNGKNDEDSLNNMFKMQDRSIKIYQGVGHDTYNCVADKRAAILDDLTAWIKRHENNL